MANPSGVAPCRGKKGQVQSNARLGLVFERDRLWVAAASGNVRSAGKRQIGRLALGKLNQRGVGSKRC
jgi:hypothetical protein